MFGEIEIERILEANGGGGGGGGKKEINTKNHEKARMLLKAEGKNRREKRK